MHYKFFISLLFFTILSGQSLFNRFIGSDPFLGSAKSTAMGNTHLLNSIGSSNVRYNPAKLSSIESKIEFDFQINRQSVYERWSIPIKDFFGEYFTNADYVVNEFSYSAYSIGINWRPIKNKFGIGYSYAPLTYFNYSFSEEIRGDYDTATDEDEYATRDPLLGYQNLNTTGKLMVSSIGFGYNLNTIDLELGFSINQINTSKIKDFINVDSIKLFDSYNQPSYSDIVNLSDHRDLEQSEIINKSNFFAFSTLLNIKNSIISFSWEQKSNAKSNNHNISIDSTNSLFKYWDSNKKNDSTFYAVKGINYLKPEILSLAFNYDSKRDTELSLTFEINHIIYNKHQNLNNYQKYKFGFEYLLDSGIPIRAGMVYKKTPFLTIKPISIFTFGTGKKINNFILDIAGNYYLQSFNYPDLFKVKNDLRSDYDLVRDSHLNIQFSLTYLY